MVDVVEILAHWYAGRPHGPKWPASLGVDPKTVRKYVAAAEAAGLAPGGPPLSEQQWRAKVRAWFPGLVDTRLRQPSWSEIDRHRERIEALVGVVPASVAHQRLVDEEGLAVSVASFRRYLRAFPRRGAPGRGGHLAPTGRSGRRSPGGLRLPGHLGRPGQRAAPAYLGLFHGP